MPEPDEVQTTDAPPAEEVDERGVPLTNRIAELERKLQDEASNREKAAQEYQQKEYEYKLALGQLQQQLNQPSQQTSTAQPAVDTQFDEPSKRFVETVATQVAEKIGWRFMTQAHNQQSLGQDNELRQEATKEYQSLKQNPLYGTLDDAVMQSIAINNAQLSLLKRKQEAANKAAQVEANRNLAGAGNLPPTQPTPPSQITDKQKFIEEFLKQPEYREICRKHYRLDPDSDKGRAKMKAAAEQEWEGTNLTGAAAMALRHADALKSTLGGGQ